MTREQLLECRETAKQEVIAARINGYRDDEILAALRKGSKSQRLYADFLEHDVLPNMTVEDMILPGKN